MWIPAPTIVPWQNGLSTHPIYLWRSNSAFILVGWILDSKFKYMWWCWLVVYTKSWKIIRNFTHLNQETITDLHCLSEKGAKSSQHDYVIVTMLFYLQNTSSGFKDYKRFILFVEQNWLSVNAIHYRVILWSHERRYGSIAYFSHKSISPRSFIIYLLLIYIVFFLPLAPIRLVWTVHYEACHKCNILPSLAFSRGKSKLGKARKKDVFLCHNNVCW